MKEVALSDVKDACAKAEEEEIVTTRHARVARRRLR